MWSGIAYCQGGAYQTSSCHGKGRLDEYLCHNIWSGQYSILDKYLARQGINLRQLEFVCVGVFNVKE